MKTRSRRCSTCLRRPGLTLLEVVASLTLLATLLVGTILAYGSHIDQVKAAQQRLQATQIAERLLVAWYETEAGVPPRDENVIEGTEGLRWRTMPLDVDDSNLFQARVIRFEIFDPSDGVKPEPLVYVDLLASEEEEKPEADEGEADA